MSTQYQAKPFVLNANDLLYLLAQVNFQPMFDAQGNAVVDWDGVSTVYNARGVAYNLTGLTQQQAWNAYGHGFPQVSAPIGIRDVTGFHNNLFGTQALWGAVDVPFRRDIPADYSNYVTSPGANYGTSVGVGGTVTQSSVIDYMPRIISQTITTGGVNLLKDTSGHYVEWSASRYASDASFKTLVDSSRAEIATLVEGAKIVAPEAAGLTLLWDATANSASIQYLTLLTLLASGGTLTGGPNGEPLADGGPIYKFDGSNYSQLGNLTFDVRLYVYHTLVVESGVNTSTLKAGDPIAVTSADVSDTITNLGTLGVVSQANVKGLLTPDPTAGSGYGMLEQLGHIDFQNPTSGEYFIGSENPGVAPVNSWFGIFGQFFDHGLDLIDKGGQGTKIKIALETTDPLYRAPGTNGTNDPGNTAITISRATVSGADANGNAAYVNHTSPFIDQSQTYGSNEQLTNLLRRWVSTDGNQTYHAGMELFDGQSLEDGWIRKTPVFNLATGQTEIKAVEVKNTLPTLNELRAHVLETGRSALTWDDVLNFRNRDANGQLADADANTAGVQTTNSGHALLLDMNPHFDAASATGGHIDLAKITSAVHSITGFETAVVSVNVVGGQLSSVSIDNSAVGGTNETLGLFKTPAPGSAGLVDVTNFSIVTGLSGGMHAAANEILLESVGDHYVAGDGRVNENFGLTSIHHVFHEEHNYQVENLKSWIYQHDAKNPGATDAHEQLHNWQVNTGTKDAYGNYTYGAGGQIAWDADKMFNATKPIVEMEYQHAAVDQYARTVTPRIQEFVGYSSGVDPTISLEYSQVAFRFGHSTIRETIDTIDPNGWFSGAVTRYALEKAFLAPQTFAKEGVAAITLGLSRQQMNEVDEFITPALNEGLLGQPLDLAAINIARGRDLGIPTLNDFRAAIGLVEYKSWDDYGKNMIHPESLVNFIAAYSFGGGADGVVKASAILGLFDGSIADGSVAALGFTAAEALAFMSNNTSGNTVLDSARLGFDKIDSWIGGLAEAHVPGGLLGETFDAVFVAQIQALMDGDRFYYLYRLFGTQIHEEVNNGQFKDIVERNTGLEHLNGSIFAYADKYYDFTRDADNNAANGLTDNFANHSYGNKSAATGLGIYSDGGASTASNGTTIAVEGYNYIRDIRPELNPAQVHTVEGTPTSGADSHEVIVGSDFRDYIHARGGDDTVYGEGGDDTIFGDNGVDRLYGGDGNDYIDTGEGPDLADGGAGKDIIYGRGSGSEVGGFDQLVGGSGNDILIGGEGIDKLSGGSGDDIIYGDGMTNPEMGNTDPFTHGGDGNDYIDGGASGDLLYGEEGDDVLVGGNDQDLIQGGTGDDILRPGNPSQAIGGGPDEVIGDDGYTNNGFDLIDFSDYVKAAIGLTIDLSHQTNPLVAIDGTTPMPTFFQVEGAIGSQNNDTILGDSNGDATADFSHGNNWLVGGSGGDTLRGNGGDDVLIGGSIRLDVLIGKYTGQAGYLDNTEDAYTGASNRATGVLDGTGLLTAAGLQKHFAEMLKSQMFKDYVLGDGGADGIDTASYSDATGSVNVNLTTGRASGADGNDLLVSIENIIGGAFDDRLTGDAGANLLSGGLGNDVLSGRVGNDRLDGQGGLDTASYSEATGAVTVDLTTGTASGADGNDVLVSIENIIGGAFDDTLTGDSGANELTGGLGNDHLSGKGGNDRLFGQAGIDTAVLSAAFIDTAFVLNADGSISISSASDGNDLISGIELLQFGTKTYSIVQGTNGSNTTLTGTGGADALLGFNGDDRLTAGAGDDAVNGGDGNDRIVATLNDGNDIYVGGSGTDTYDLSGTSANANVDLVAGTASSSQTGNDILSSIENVVGSSGANVIVGNSGANRLEGLAGNDALFGGGGADTLLGGTGADILVGGAGADTIYLGLNDNARDLVRITATVDYRDEVFDFSSIGTQRDAVSFSGVLNTQFNDVSGGGSNVIFASAGPFGRSSVSLGQFEGLYFSGSGNGVTTAQLGNANSVANAINAKFTIQTSGGNNDALVVMNDTNGNDFAVWQLIESGTLGVQANELSLVGLFHSNSTVTTGQFIYET